VVGTFADIPVRGRGTGTFAGDADPQPKGSFADAERDLIVRYGIERPASAAARPSDRSCGRSASTSAISSMCSQISSTGAWSSCRDPEMVRRAAVTAPEHVARAA
jgi:hypothetical protein